MCGLKYCVKGHDTMKIKTVLKISITAILLYLVIKISNPEKIIESLVNIKIRYLLFALGLTPFFIFIRTIKWHYLINLDTQIKYSDSVKSFLVGWGVALVTPSRIGEFSRVLYLKDVNKIKASGLIFADKIFDLATIMPLSILGIVVLIGNAVTTTLAVSSLTILVALYNLDLVSKVLFKFSNHLPLKDKINELIKSIEIISGRKTPTFCIGLSLIAYVTIFVQGDLILTALGSEIGFSAVFFTLPLIILANALPISISGFGVREGASILLLQNFGVPTEIAITFSFLLFILNNLVPGIAGILLSTNMK